MNQRSIVFLFLALLVGGSIWYGLARRDASASSRPEVKERLALADKFLDQGDGSRAAEVLSNLEAEGYPLGERGEFLRVKAYDIAGDHAAAAKAANEYLKNWPDMTRKTEVELVRLSSELSITGLANPDLQRRVEEFLARNPKHEGAGKLQVALARQELDRGDVSAARHRLSSYLDHAPVNSPHMRGVERFLGEVNLELLRSPALHEGDYTYTVQRGDYVAKIAREHGVTQELLMACNGIDDPRRLRVGQNLKIPNVDFSLICNISDNTMKLLNNGRFFKTYDVRTGRESGTTPSGTYRILNKKVNPTWKPGDGRVYPPGDPNNELGTRWMAFEGDILGIHGTIHPETVGEYASNGCIGMTRKDVEELFDLVVVGTPLIIEGNQDLTRHRVIPAQNIPDPQQVASR